MRLLPKANNAFLGNSVFIFLIRLFPSVTALLIVIYYSRNLTKDNYGLYQNFWIQLNIFFPLACYGIHVFIITYSKGVILRLLNSITRKQYLLYFGWLLIPCGIFAWLQHSRSQMLFIIPLLYIITYSASFVLESFLIVCKEYKSLTLISLFYSVAYWLVHYYVLQGGFSLSALFNYLLVISAIRFCLYAGMTSTRVKATVADVLEDVSIQKVRALWLHLGLYDVLQLLFAWIDKFIISLVLTASLSAVYFNGSMNIPVLPLLLTATGNAVLMQLANGNKNNGTKAALQLMNQSARVLSCLVFPAFFFLLLFRRELFSLLLPGYAMAVPVFFVSILTLPLKAYSFTTLLQNRHKGKIINAGAIADLLIACALMYPLYQWMGLPGVALSFVITSYLQAVFYLYYTARELQVSIFLLLPLGNWLIKLIVFLALFIAIHYILSVYFTIRISLILGAGASAIVALSALYVELKNRTEYVSSSENEI